jgi:ribosomal protein S18 acetylase RimI-like enzyme
VSTHAFSIRPVEDHELDAWLELRNRSFPWPVDRDRFLFEEGLRPPDEPLLRLGAWSRSGEIAGTAECYVGEEGERYIDRAESFVMVGPAYRRLGVGSQLADEVERFAKLQKIRWLEALCYQRDAALAQSLLERRGFRELERYQESWQDPSAVPLAGLEDLRARLAEQGIRTASFSEVDSDAMRRALYQCGMEIEHDMPHEASLEWHDPPFEVWIRKVLHRPGGSAEAVFVAVDRRQIVGLTYLVGRANGDAEVGDTGVVGSHRRRGIARALKLMATRYAAQHGIRRVQTDNRSDNVGMLAINRELGFEPGQLILIFEKTLVR